MTLDQFVASRNGQQNISFDGVAANAGQCVQLVAFYVRDVIGKQVIWADAFQWWATNRYPEDYDRIPNTPTAVPQRGDIIIWGGSLPNSGGAGHIAICLQPYPGTGTFMSFDSNWGGKYAHQVTHNYSYVVGWLRPKNAPAPVVQGGDDEMIPNPDMAAKVYHMLRPNGGANQDEINATAGKRSYNAFVNDAAPEVAARDANLREQANILQNQQNIINQLNQTITELRAMASQDALKDVELAKQLDDSHGKIALLTTDLETAHDQLAQLQAALPTPLSTATPPTEAQASALTRFIAFLERLLKKN